MINFTTSQPLKSAVSSLSARTPVGSAMRSAEWSAVPLDIKRRSFWISTVENERVLAIAQAKISRRLNLQRSKLADGSEGVVMDRSRFIAEMQDELEAVGYKPDPAFKGGLRDVSSHRRLALVWDMQLAQAEGFAAHKAATSDPDVLDAFPAWELVRGENRENERDWPEIWARAGGEFYGEPGADYPEAPGRMLALVTDPIWTAISQFGVPWPPFRWGSGMILQRIRRRVAEELQVIRPDDVLEVPGKVDFNEGLKASVHGLPQVSQDRLRSELGDMARFDGADDVHFEKPEVREDSADFPAELDARAAEFAELVPEASPDYVRAGISSAAVGRVQLFQAKLGNAAASLADALRKILPSNLMIEARGGRLFVWRADRADLSIDSVDGLAAPHLGGNGVLRGFGQDVGAGGVLVEISKGGKTVLAFDAPATAAKGYAAMRLRDFTAALGEGYSVKIDGKEVSL